MAVIKEYQLVSMNQHYKRFSLDYYLDCQQKVGFKILSYGSSISLLCRF